MPYGLCAVWAESMRAVMCGAAMLVAITLPAHDYVISTQTLTGIMDPLHTAYSGSSCQQCQKAQHCMLELVRTL